MALAEYAWRTDRRAVPLVVDGHPAALSLVVNLSPWTYVGARAMNPAPRAGVADGLAVYAPQRLTAGSFAHLLAQIARGRDVAREGVYAAGDRPTVDLTADRPMWIQVDGEAVGQVTAATFRHMPAALSIVV
jgi:diacylglycerol kinase family enzyme